MITIDPGVHACGVAIFRDRQLEAAWYGNPNCRALAQPEERLIIEMPRIYPGSGQQKGDLNDLLDLAAVVGRVEGMHLGYCNEPERVFPARWKGQVPKKIMTKRILSKLSAGELTRIRRVGAKDHNTIDAIGIGLHFLGRL